MPTVQCPQCRTVQMAPPPQAGPAVCIHCRGTLYAAPPAQTGAPLPPHLRQPTAPPKPAPAGGPAVAPEPKQRRRIEPRGIGYEIGLYAGLVAIVVGGVFLVARYARYEEEAKSAEQQKDDFVYVIEQEPTGNEAIFWTDASRRSQRKHGLKIRVDRVLVREVLARDADRRPIAVDDVPRLQIHLNVRNQWQEPKRHVPWFGNTFVFADERRGARLIDDQGRTYVEAKFPQAQEVQGVAEERTLAAKEDMDEVLFFDIPPTVDVRQVKYWRLSLPAAAVGDIGLFRFEIPQAMLE